MQPSSAISSAHPSRCSLDGFAPSQSHSWERVGLECVCLTPEATLKSLLTSPSQDMETPSVTPDDNLNMSANYCVW